MVNKKYLALKVLINRFHPKESDLFLKPLPDIEKQEVLKITSSQKDPEKLYTNLEEFVKSIHYTWLLPHMEKYSLQNKTLALASLPINQAQGLKTLLNKETIVPLKLSSLGKKLLVQKYFPNLLPHEIMPEAFLETSAFQPLLNLDKNSLLQLIDYLGIYDLAEKIRNVVDKKKLAVIYRALSLDEQKFLRYALRNDKTSLSDLDLTHLTENSSKLKTILHRKGLVRLAKGISYESSDFIWHLFHKLDTGRAAFIEKNLLPKPNELIKEKLKRQILHVLNLVSLQEVNEK